MLKAVLITFSFRDTRKCNFRLKKLKWFKTCFPRSTRNKINKKKTFFRHLEILLRIVPNDLSFSSKVFSKKYKKV